MGSSSPLFLSATFNRCASLPILLLCLLFVANAERDFNVNDSQVSGAGRKMHRINAALCASRSCCGGATAAALSFVC